MVLGRYADPAMAKSFPPASHAGPERGAALWRRAAPLPIAPGVLRRRRASRYPLADGLGDRDWKSTRGRDLRLWQPWRGDGAVVAKDYIFTAYPKRRDAGASRPFLAQHSRFRFR